MIAIVTLFIITKTALDILPLFSFNCQKTIPEILMSGGCKYEFLTIAALKREVASTIRINHEHTDTFS